MTLRKLFPQSQYTVTGSLIAERKSSKKSVSRCWAWLSLAAVMLAAPVSGDAAPPQPFGPIPAANQLRWHNMEFYGFLHFGINTFTDKEWGYGDESPELFNPTAFDADQIARTAREAGMKGLIQVCKHHDGFCLWPTRTTEHSIKHSSWRGGKGDLVKEMAEACKKHGLAFGVYLSPWDRNHPNYGTPTYVECYREQLYELLTGYGEVFVTWHDGANGGDGYYGGKRETRRIDASSYYGWPETWSIVRRLQPKAVIFSDAGPDVRWVGNEDGTAGEPCWGTLGLAGRYPGGPGSNQLPQGQRNGANWVPPECDVSIRPGWFYHAREDSKVKTPAQLLDIYYRSVGRGACLNLNVPPDRRGLIHENDAKSLREFSEILRMTFATNLARNAKLTTSNTRGGDKRFDASKLVDSDRDSYWAVDDSVTAAEVIIEFGKPATFSVIGLREYLPLGQRIDAFALDKWQDGRWVEFASGTSIGNLRLLRTQGHTATRVRLRITKTSACPVLSELGLYLEPNTAPQ